MWRKETNKSTIEWNAMFIYENSINWRLSSCFALFFSCQVDYIKFTSCYCFDLLSICKMCVLILYLPLVQYLLVFENICLNVWNYLKNGYWMIDHRQSYRCHCRNFLPNCFHWNCFRCQSDRNYHFDWNCRFHDRSISNWNYRCVR